MKIKGCFTLKSTPRFGFFDEDGLGRTMINSDQEKKGTKL